MKNNTLKNLIIFGAFAFLFIFTNNVSAYYTTTNAGYVTADPSASYRNTYNPYASNQNNNYNQNAYNQNGTYSTNSTNSTNNQPVAPIVNNYYYSTTAPSTVAKTTTVSNLVVAQKDNSTVVKSATATDSTLKPLTDTATGNNLTALSLNGSGGFMPSSIWQWLLVIFLILIIIIVARMLGNKPASNDPHAVHAH